VTGFSLFNAPSNLSTISPTCSIRPSSQLLGTSTCSRAPFQVTDSRHWKASLTRANKQTTAHTKAQNLSATHTTHNTAVNRNKAKPWWKDTWRLPLVGTCKFLYRTQTCIWQKTESCVWVSMRLGMIWHTCLMQSRVSILWRRWRDC